MYRSGKWKAGESAVIVIGGTITASGPFPSNDSMINGNGKDGRVLYIANNKFTLGNNLALTGGDELWGGAVFTNSGGTVSGNTPS